MGRGRRAWKDDVKSKNSLKVPKPDILSKQLCSKVEEDAKAGHSLEVSSLSKLRQQLSGTSWDHNPRKKSKFSSTMDSKAK